MTRVQWNQRIQYAAENANPHDPEMCRLIRAWNKLDNHDKQKIEHAMKPVLALPGVGGLVALELAAKIGMFFIDKGVTEL